MNYPLIGIWPEFWKKIPLDRNFDLPYQNKHTECEKIEDSKDDYLWYLKSNRWYRRGSFLQFD